MLRFFQREKNICEKVVISCCSTWTLAGAHLAGHFCRLDEFVDGDGKFAGDRGGVAVVVEVDVHVRLLGEIVDALHVDHLLELGPGLHGAVHLLGLEQEGEGEAGGAGHAWLEVLRRKDCEELLSLSLELQRSHQEGMISFVAVEQGQPGEVTATLRLDSNLGNR